MREPLIIGHRGASAVAPENTIAAFQAAIDAGADGVEFDVHLSRDGVPVIIHDETLWRTAGLRRRVIEMTAEELRQVDVPSLRDLFELVRDSELLLYLEIKARAAKLPELCCRLVNEFSFRDRVIVECFDLPVLKAVEFKTAALFDSRIYTERSLIDRALAVGASVLALHYRLAKASLINRAKLAGLETVVWTVDDPAWIDRAREMKIEALITNAPATMIEATDRVRVQLS